MNNDAYALITSDRPWPTFDDVYQAAAKCDLIGKDERITTAKFWGFALYCHLMQRVLVDKWPWVIGWSVPTNAKRQLQLTLVPDSLLCDDSETLTDVLQVLHADKFAFTYAVAVPHDLHASTETYAKQELLRELALLFAPTSALTSEQQDVIRRWVKHGYSVDIVVQKTP